ncbi:unnamed protein product [Mucor hiemalis]
MFAGHFGPVTVLQKYYPKTSPYVLTIGVCFLDIVFGLLSYFGVEGWTANPLAGALGATLHCRFSHSLIGSVLLSVFYGVVTKSFVPGFLASFSHFIGDWLVHNQDLPLHPFSKIMVGGTNMWGNYPTFAFYFELAFCVFCALLSSKDRSTLIASGFIIFLHVSSQSTTATLVGKIVSLSDVLRQRYTALLIISSFMIPALILGYILQSRQRLNKIK